MKNISKTIAQYNDLWADAVISTGKNDCTPSLVLLDNIDYYDKYLSNPNNNYKINTSIYQSLKAPKAWKHLTIEEKIFFCADYLYDTAIKVPYLLPQNTNINRFIQTATQEIERVKNGTGLSFSENTDRQDVIHYSALPWFAFSEMKHATSFKNGDSVPRISTGKLMQENSKYLLPISVCAHHGLMDGRNVAELIRKLSDNQTAL